LTLVIHEYQVFQHPLVCGFVSFQLQCRCKYFTSACWSWERFRSAFNVFEERYHLEQQCIQTTYSVAWQYYLFMVLLSIKVLLSA